MAIPDHSFKKITNAIAFAIEAHGQQKRKARNSKFVPYMVHPMEVMAILFESNVNPTIHDPNCERDCNILCAAILHDVLEDTDRTEEDIRMMFGMEVLRIVQGLTDNPTQSKEQQRQAQLDHMLTATYDIRCIKVADKTSNVRDLVRCPPGWKTSSVKAYSDHAALVVAHAAAKQDLPTLLVESFWRAKKEVNDWISEQEMKENVLSGTG
jgi:guanosine-3',5'-bis(diphosphate) 3'-pyrophosphohydrolase